MKIAVIGTCQVRTIAACLSVMIPEAEVQEVWVAQSRQNEQRHIWENIHEFDALIMQPVQMPMTGKELEQRARRVIWFPAINFNGSQPDDVIIPSLIGAFGANHSAIVVSSFLLGLSESRCRKLFNAFVYASLGYFERFEIEKQRLLATTRKMGCPIDGHFDQWAPDFMYDIFHPKLEPLASFADVLSRLLTGRAAPADVDWSSVVPEPFHRVSTVWPIYPEIAERLGVATRDIYFTNSYTPDAGMPLSAFIERSYAVYQKADRILLRNTVAREVAIIAELLGMSASTASEPAVALAM